MTTDKNGWKWMEMDEHGWKWMKINENGWKLMKMGEHGKKVDESRRKYPRYYMHLWCPPSLFSLISNKFNTSQKFHNSEHSPSLSKPLLLNLNPKNIQNVKKAHRAEIWVSCHPAMQAGLPSNMSLHLDSIGRWFKIFSSEIFFHF